MNVRVGIVDDHQLFLKSLGHLIESYQGYEVVVEANNGADLIKQLDQPQKRPDILLLDVNMPAFDGPSTAKAVSERFPAMKLVALSMKDDDATIIRMIRAGCCAYLLKDIHPDNLEKALHEVNILGYYNADESNLRYRRLLQREEADAKLVLNDKEKTFLKLACSDYTYKQIADMMHLSERTIDGYRESLFHKLQVLSRVGMVLEALRSGLINLDDTEGKEGAGS